MEKFEVKDYQIFDNAQSTVSKLNDDLDESNTSIEKCKTSLSDDTIFMGPVADECINAFGKVSKGISNLITNSNTIKNYLAEVSDGYKSGDNKAAKYLLIGADGILSVSTTNTYTDEKSISKETVNKTNQSNSYSSNEKASNSKKSSNNTSSYQHENNNISNSTIKKESNEKNNKSTEKESSISESNNNSKTTFSSSEKEARQNVVLTALKELNGHSSSYHTNGKKYLAYFGKHSGLWCSEFTSWVFNAAGVPQDVVKKFSGADSGSDWFEKNRRLVKKSNNKNYIPQIGDILFTGKGKATHTCIVVKSDGNGKFTTIDGGTKSVHLRNRNIKDSNIYAFGIPDYSKMTKL